MPAPAIALDHRYRLDELIGRGGMADVYRAHDLRLDRDVAVKVLREVEHGPRFEVEVHTLAALDHPNLVRLLDAGEDDDRLFLVMELLGGASVLELLAAGPVPSDRVRAIAGEAAAGLAHIHERGIVHRDVKPSNLMFDEHGTLRIADFGIVHLVDGATLTGTHQTIGTMAYLAPEQLRGREITPAADVYALGLVVLECLTGARAFTGAPAEVAAARLHHDPSVPASLPAPWPELLRAMTAREPGHRPSAPDAHRRLVTADAWPALEPTAVLAASAVEAAAPTVPIDTPDTDTPRARRVPRRLLPSLVVVALVAAIAGGLWIANTDDSTVAPAIPPTTTEVTTVPTSSPPASAPVVPPTTVPPVSVTPPVVDEKHHGDKGKGEGGAEGRGHGGGRGGSGSG